MNVTSSSLLVTCRYSDMVPQPGRSASRAIDNAPRPSASARSTAASTIRSRLSPRGRRAPVGSRHSTSSARGNGSSSLDRHGRSSTVSTLLTHPTRWLAPALALVVVAFLAFALPPYFIGDPAKSRVPATFVLHYPLLVGHVMLASVAMAAAVAQIWPGLRNRHQILHRRVGRAYVFTAIPAAVCAMVIGAATPFGPILAVSNVGLASLWLWFTANGYLAARQRRFAEHRRHMIRSATLALSIITNRIWTLVLLIALHPLQDSVFHGNEGAVHLGRGGDWRVVGMDDPTAGRTMVADPQTGNAAIVDSTGLRLAAGCEQLTDGFVGRCRSVMVA